MHKDLAIRLNNQGFSLVETLIAVAVSITVLAIASSEVRRSLELKKLVQNQDVITDLEAKIRRAVKDNISLARSQSHSLKLEECLGKEGKDCSVTYQRKSKKSGSKVRGEAFDLYLVSGADSGEVEQKLTGSYDGSGRVCSAGCPMTVTTDFYGVCGSDDAKCDVIETLVVNYAIDIEDKTQRSGLVTVSYNHSSTSDENIPCGLDANNNSKFANSVWGGAVKCVELPQAERKLTGVNPGACVMGKEVLVGFDPTTKDAICVLAKFGAAP